jgi:quercetin dioxygenase-like cupin family protein
MAYRNKVIINPMTGQEIRFLQTGKDTAGKLLEMEATYFMSSREPAPHYHPYQEEDFKVISGELSVRMGGGKVCTLKAGDRLHVSAGQVHSMWNTGNAKTVVNWQVRRALDTEYLLETMTGLAVDGKTNAAGMPGILQIALTAGKYGNVIRLAKPSPALQNILFSILRPLAWLLGYQSTYKKYLD